MKDEVFFLVWVFLGITICLSNQIYKVIRAKTLTQSIAQLTSVYLRLLQKNEHNLQDLLMVNVRFVLGNVLNCFHVWLMLTLDLALLWLIIVNRTVFLHKSLILIV